MPNQAQPMCHFHASTHGASLKGEGVLACECIFGHNSSGQDMIPLTFSTSVQATPSACQHVGDMISLRSDYISSSHTRLIRCLTHWVRLMQASIDNPDNSN